MGKFIIHPVQVLRALSKTLGKGWISASTLFRQSSTQKQVRQKGGKTHTTCITFFCKSHLEWTINTISPPVSTLVPYKTCWAAGKRKSCMGNRTPGVIKRRSEARNSFPSSLFSDVCHKSMTLDLSLFLDLISILLRDFFFADWTTGNLILRWLLFKL